MNQRPFENARRIDIQLEEGSFTTIDIGGGVSEAEPVVVSSAVSTIRSFHKRGLGAPLYIRQSLGDPGRLSLRLLTEHFFDNHDYLGKLLTESGYIAAHATFNNAAHGDSQSSGQIPGRVAGAFANATSGVQRKLLASRDPITGRSDLSTFQPSHASLSCTERADTKVRCELATSAMKHHTYVRFPLDEDLVLDVDVVNGMYWRLGFAVPEVDGDDTVDDLAEVVSRLDEGLGQWLASTVRGNPRFGTDLFKAPPEVFGHIADRMAIVRSRLLQPALTNDLVSTDLFVVRELVPS